MVCAEPRQRASVVLSVEAPFQMKLRVKFTLSVHIDEQAEPVELECAYDLLCYEIKLDPSGMT